MNRADASSAGSGAPRPLATIRAIAPADIPAVFDVRVSTDENRLTRAQLTAMGITEASVLQRMQGTFRGWLAEVAGRVVGFAMGDRATGELWVIAVRPEHTGCGVGSALIRHVENWLGEQGCSELWLTTDVDTKLRAYAFYRRHGWTDWKIERDLRYMKKRRPAVAAGG